MEIICLCCLAETTLAYKTSTKCEFRADECYDANEPPKMMELGEIYAQLTQLPPTLEIPSRTNQLMCDTVCTRCVGMLKDFYLFRMTALRAREELQTKANIAKIINNLEQCIDGSVAAEHAERDLALIISNTRLESSKDTANNDNELYGCRTCSKKFKKRKLLKRHEEIHLLEKGYHCRYCGLAFAAKASCYNHELRVHRNLIKPKEEKTIATRKGFKCTDTKRERVIPHKTECHKESDHLVKDKLFQCDLCTKSFTRKSSLNEHKMVLHAGVRQYACSICSRAFGKEDSLNTHMALHVGKKFRCKLCSKAFAKGSFLRKHLEEHELPDSKRKFACAVCSKSFNTMSHLNDHALIHSDKRPHKCPNCGKSFRQKQQLKVHTYQHTGKPFQCTYCDLSYTTRSRLGTHVNKHHPDHDEQLTNKTNPAVAVETCNILQPDFGDKAVNEEMLNEICDQINSNPIILENIEAGGVNLICNENIVFLNE